MEPELEEPSAGIRYYHTVFMANLAWQIREIVYILEQKTTIVELEEFG